MDLEQQFVALIENIGPMRWKRMFGLQAILIDGKLMGGYRLIDENIIYLLLILSKPGFEKAIDSGYFTKFDFGKTWVEGEIESEEELELIRQTIKHAHAYTITKKAKTKRRAL